MSENYNYSTLECKNYPFYFLLQLNTNRFKRLLPHPL